MYKSNDMRLSQFKFKLPEELIAQYPASYRDEARLMVLHRTTGEVEHVTLPELVNFRRVCGDTRRKRMPSSRSSFSAN